MTELDILIHAKDYIDKLAQGIDPISGQEVPEDSVINQARLVRCFFYVSGVLQKVIDNGGTVVQPPKKKSGRAYFQITDEMRKNVVYSSSVRPYPPASASCAWPKSGIPPFHRSGRAPCLPAEW